jgi:NADH-quinone oxidoreductase subunit C
VTREEIAAQLKTKFGDVIGDLGGKPDAWVTVKDNARLVEVLRYLKETPGLEMDFLANESGTDFPKENVLRVVYHLFSYKHRHDFIVKVDVPREGPRLPTMDGLWKTAEWFEREIYDLFGVEFDGHPDLRRIMMPDDWIGHPLRKDYKEPESWHGINTTRESPLEGYVRLDDMLKKAKAALAPAPPAAPAPAAAPIPPEVKN